MWNSISRGFKGYFFSENAREYFRNVLLKMRAFMRAVFPLSILNVLLEIEVYMHG